MSRKDPYFSFKDRDSVEYKPQYGTAYTPRQEKILSGELPLEDIRPNELSLLKQKAKHLGDMEGYEIATLRYHDITWDSLPIKNRTSSLDELKRFYESLPSAKE